MRNRKETINLLQCETEMFVTEIEEAQAANPSVTARGRASSSSLSLQHIQTK